MENEEIEIRLLLEAVYLKYGYDFRNYAGESLQRRILHRLGQEPVASISELQHLILNHLDAFERMLLDLSVHVTKMFRNPGFFQVLRDRVLPCLEDEPFIRVWIAGCATGEEAYSMAILLTEAGLFDRSQIYATDMNEQVLSQAKSGIFPNELIKAYTKNYQKAGGRTSFSDYYTADCKHAMLIKALRKKILFASHNLVTDGVFAEMNLILCRNVMIYFNPELRNQVYRLFQNSLNPAGFLCLGSKETLQFSCIENAFDEVHPKAKIYRKKTVASPMPADG